MFRSSGQERVFSPRVYNLIIGAVLLYGFIVNYLICTYLVDIFYNWNQLLIFILYFVISISGANICESSSDSLVAFTGYNMVVIPVGVILSIGLKDTDSISIMNAIAVTGCVVALLLLFSTCFPDFFSSLREVLGVTILGVIFFELLFTLFRWYEPQIWDLICTCIFALCVGYFWAEAQKKKYTLRNAIVSCVGLYLAVVNIFIRNTGSVNSKINKNN